MAVIDLFLDTSAYSAFKRGNLEIIDLARKASRIYVNSIVIGESLSGFKLGNREAQNRVEFEAFLRSPRVEILGLIRDTSERYAEILCYLRKSGTPVPTNNLWIAASVMEHGLMLITTDHHFQRIPHILSTILAQ